MNAEEIVMAVLELIARGCKIGLSVEIYGNMTGIRVYPYDEAQMPKDDES